MNTNTNSPIMTICRIFAQKQGGSMVPLNKKTNSRSMEDSISTGQKTDNNDNISGKKTDQDEAPRFDQTLRDKMKADANNKPDNRKDSKEKGLKDKKSLEEAQNPHIQSDQNAVKPKKLEISIPCNNVPVEPATQIDTKAEGDTSTPVVSTSDQIPIAQASDKTETDQKSSETVSPKPEAQKPDVTAQKSMQQAQDGQTQSAEKVENPGIPDKNTPQTGSGNSADVNKSKVTVQSPEIQKNNREVPQEAMEPLMKKISKDIDTTKFAVRQQAPSVKEDIQNKIQPNQKMPDNDFQPDISKGQASVHRINVSMEQIESIKTEKQQQITEKTDIKADSGVEKQLPHEFSANQTMSENSQSTTRQAEVVINEASTKLNVGQQIQESVKTTYTQGTQQIVIRLDPPDLGRVTIRFTENQDGITGTLHVDKVDTKYEIQQALPLMMQNLQNSDIQIRKMEVILNNQQQDNAAGDFTNPNDNFQQQDSSGPNTSPSGLSYEQQSSSKDAFNAADSYMELSDKSINMLI